LPLRRIFSISCGVLITMAIGLPIGASLVASAHFSTAC
jgi:hypothetical protein